MKFQLFVISILAQLAFAIDCPPSDASATQAYGDVATPTDQAGNSASTDQAMNPADPSFGGSPGGAMGGSSGGLTYAKKRLDYAPKESCTPVSNTGNYTSVNGTNGTNATTAYGNTTFVGTGGFSPSNKTGSTNNGTKGIGSGADSIYQGALNCIGIGLALLIVT